MSHQRQHDWRWQRGDQRGMGIRPSQSPNPWPKYPGRYQSGHRYRKHRSWLTLLQARSMQALGPTGIVRASAPMIARDLGFLRGRAFAFFKRTMLCFPISRTRLQWVDQPRSLDTASWKGLLGMVILHIDMLIPGVGEVPTVEVGFRVALVLPNQIPSCEDSSSHILGKFEYSKRVSMKLPTSIRDSGMVPFWTYSTRTSPK